MNIDGIIRVSNEKTDGYYYTTDEMFKNNILIEEICLLLDKNTIRTDLNLYYYDDTDAKTYMLGIGIPDASIFAFTSVKEIVNIFESSSLEDFLSIIEEFAEGQMFASYQMSKKVRKNVRESIIDNFKEYTRIIAESD